MSIQCRIQLPDAVFDRYDAEAARRGIPVEELFAQRLAHCQDHTAEKPLYFNDSERQTLERYLGRNVLNVSDTLVQIRNAMSVRVHKVIVPLETQLLAKLKSRAIRVPFEEFLQTQVVQSLERYVGLR